MNILTFKMWEDAAANSAGGGGIDGIGVGAKGEPGVHLKKKKKKEEELLKKMNIQVSKQSKPLNVTVIMGDGRKVATIRRDRARSFLLTLYTGDRPFTSTFTGKPTNLKVFTTRKAAVDAATAILTDNIDYRLR